MALCNFATWTIDNIIRYISIHCTPKKSHGLETRSDPSPDGHSHHGSSNRQECDISEEALVDGT